MREWESDLLLRETQLAHREAVLRNTEARLSLFAAFASRHAAPLEHAAAHVRGQDPSDRVCSEPGVAASRPADSLATQPMLAMSDSSEGCGNGVDGCGVGAPGVGGGSGSGCDFSGESHCNSGGEATLNMLSVTSIFEAERLALLEEFAGYAIIATASYFLGIAVPRAR